MKGREGKGRRMKGKENTYFYKLKYLFI